MSRATEFNKDDIIIKAMNIFWSKGYENTSLRDLMDATGLQKGSIYNTFESKENLFLLCLEKYGNDSKVFHYKDGDPGKYLQNFFRRIVKQGLDKDFVKGCMVMNSCMEFAEKEAKLAKKSQILFSNTEKNFTNVVNIFFNDSKSTQEKKRVQTNLVAAAFSIREISKFKKDKNFLIEIANNALRELNLAI